MIVSLFYKPGPWPYTESTRIGRRESRRGYKYLVTIILDYNLEIQLVYGGISLRGAILDHLIFYYLEGR